MGVKVVSQRDMVGGHLVIWYRRTGFGAEDFLWSHWERIELCC